MSTPANDVTKRGHTVQQTDTIRQRVLSGVKKPLGALLRQPLASALLTPLVSPRRVDDYLELVDPCWSLDQVRARVIAVQRETRNVTSLLVQPNENWRGHRAGQHVQLTVNVDGVQQIRSFSLSNAPTPGQPLRLTIKAHDSGCVSRWVNERAQVGDVITLSQAQGQFVLPEVLPSKLLFVSGGSGLTPLVAMAQELVSAGYLGALTWLHYERDEAPLENELHALIDRLHAGRLIVQHTGSTHANDNHLGAPTRRHLSLDQLAALVPDWHEHEVFVCGPRPLMTSVSALFADHGLSEHVHSEQFQPLWQSNEPQPSTGSSAHRHLVFARSGKQSDARPGVSLLEQAEQAGLRPLHGCRMGICHTCICKKHSGTVRNELTGLTSDARDEEIQLCIHTPLTDVSLDL